mmetsp:Transcript_63727/g.142143  ORF Transcript_63727/g.142143 Transcript_63727/m.142143 type:complete len:275 (+) Transcript_63727:1505-2329(+)
MAHTELMDVCESGQHLQTQLSQRGHREISGDAVGGVGREEIAVEIKEGVSQEFRHNEQMLLMVEIIQHFKDWLGPGRVTLCQQCQNPYLAESLIEAILFILEHLDTHHHLELQIECLHDAAERTFANYSHNSIPFHQHQPHLKWKIRIVFKPVDVGVVENRQRYVSEITLHLRSHLRRVVEDDAVHVITAPPFPQDFLILGPWVQFEVKHLGLLSLLLRELVPHCGCGAAAGGDGFICRIKLCGSCRKRCEVCDSDCTLLLPKRHRDPHELLEL